MREEKRQNTKLRVTGKSKQCETEGKASLEEESRRVHNQAREQLY